MLLAPGPALGACFPGARPFVRPSRPVEPQVKGQPVNVKNKSLCSVAALNPIDDDELSNVSGGRAEHSDLHVMKPIDSASPKLYEATCKGTHIPEVSI